MSFFGVMTHKEIHKIQFGGFNKKSYKRIRTLIRVRMEKELGLKFKK